MRKHQTLLIALALFLCSAVAAQAQNNFVVVQMDVQPIAEAREGGKSEMAGSVWLTFSTGAAAADTTVTLRYSVPLAGNISDSPTNTVTLGKLYTSAAAEVTGTAADTGNNDNGTVVVSGLPAATTTLVIRNVMLDVSNASGPVTAEADVESSDATDFIRIEGPNLGTVISDIKLGLTAAAGDPGTVRTRGTSVAVPTAELTLKESFGGAFKTDDELIISFSGVPAGAVLAAVVTSNPDPLTAGGDGAEVSPPTANNEFTVSLGGTVGSVSTVAPKEVVLELTLTADSENTAIAFPLDQADVMAMASFTGVDFAEEFTDGVPVFNIRPAQCELLFHVVTVQLPWDTAISVTNPAFTGEMAPGALTFTFYGQDATLLPYKADASILSTGLSDDGTLAAGGTYQVMASQLLAAAPDGGIFDTADGGTDFVGHVHLLADYTQCSGLGWVTDFQTVNQAYTAIVIDPDTGQDEN